MIENNQVLSYANTQSKKKDVFVIFVLQETKNCNLFDKNYVLKTTSNGIFNVKKVDLDESQFIT